MMNAEQQVDCCLFLCLFLVPPQYPSRSASFFSPRRMIFWDLLFGMGSVYLSVCLSGLFFLCMFWSVWFGLVFFIRGSGHGCCCYMPRDDECE